MAKHRAKTSIKKLISSFSALLIAMSALVVGAVTAQAAPVVLTVTHIGWDVVGLDSNDVTDGPNTFPQGYRVCNTSTDTDATNVEADWGWTSTNTLINLDGDSNREIGILAANSCEDFYWTVTVTRDSNAYDTSRNYVVTVTDGTTSANTGTQLIYVEHLVSQNRNVVNGVTGPTSVALGDTVQFVLSGATATQGYEQIVTAPVLTSAIFEITSVTGSYAVGGNISNFYYDACGWDPAGFDVSTWNCLSTGKAGGDPITVTVTAKVIGTGTAAVGGIIYDFSGSSFHYNSDYSAGVLTVTASAPVRTIDAVDNAETTAVDTAVEVDVLANDTASNATVNSASVTITQQPTNGTVSVDPLTGKVTYTPNSGYTGTDTFKYSIATNEDASVTDEATVTITIEAPVVTPPTAVNDADTTPVNTPVEVDVLVNDTVGSNPLDPTSVSITAQPANGSVSVDPVSGKITYTPDPGHLGTDSFTYEVCDTANPANCDTAVVTITIEAPVVTPPTAVNDADTTPVNTPVEVDVLVNDTVGSNPLDPTSVSITAQPTYGNVSVDAMTGKVTYTPNYGYTGTDNFTYEVCDTANPANCDTAVVTITITPDDTPPAEEVVVDEVAEVDEKLVIDPTTLDPNAPEIDPTTVEVTEGPQNGTVTVDPMTGKITYTPNPGFAGTDSFKFKAASVDDPSVFVEFVYNVTVAEDANVKTDDNLASTGSDVLALLTVALLLVVMGSTLLLRKSRG